MQSSRQDSVGIRAEDEWAAGDTPFGLAERGLHDIYAT